jgi:putative transposase
LIEHGHVLQEAGKFGGMETSDAKRLRELEAENVRLKKLLAEAALDNQALKVAFGVKR